MNWFWSPRVILFKNILSKDRIYHVFPNCLFTSFSETSGKHRSPRGTILLNIHPSSILTSFCNRRALSFSVSAPQLVLNTDTQISLPLSCLSCCGTTLFLPSSILMLVVGSTYFSSTCL